MRALLVLLTLSAGLALIGAKPRHRAPALLAAPDDARTEPESWLAGEAEAYTDRS
jgi:hypothetical protein